MPDAQASTLILFNLLAFLVPVGLTLLAIGASPEQHAEDVATSALLALAAAFVGYFVCGFALQFGGVAWVSGLPGLAGLSAEWSPLDLTWGPGWGLIGLRGFLLQDQAYNADAYLLFGSQLTAVTTAVLIVLLAICKHTRRTVQLAIGLLVSGLIYPLFGNWLWGGGWLANLGTNLELGHGLVDAAGSGAVFLLGALVAQSVFSIVKPRRVPEPGPARLPPMHFPLWMVIGALLALVGWPGLALGNVLLREHIQIPLVLVNLALGAGGGALAASLYSWFVATKPDGMAVGRGTVAGLVAVSAACAFVPAWAALVIGLGAGILFLLGLWACEHWLHLDDPSASAATFGLPGLWGLVAVAVFADGRWGAGWNAVGVQEYRGIAGQGVSGLILAPGFQPNGSAQLYAQLSGVAALLVVGLLLPWLIFKGALWIGSLGQQATPAGTTATEASAAELAESDLLEADGSGKDAEQGDSPDEDPREEESSDDPAI